jgi:hypothetical protein
VKVTVLAGLGRATGLDYLGRIAIEAFKLAARDFAAQGRPHISGGSFRFFVLGSAFVGFDFRVYIKKQQQEKVTGLVKTQGQSSGLDFNLIGFRERPGNRGIRDTLAAFYLGQQFTYGVSQGAHLFLFHPEASRAASLPDKQSKPPVAWDANSFRVKLVDWTKVMQWFGHKVVCLLLISSGQARFARQPGVPPAKVK